LLNWNLVKDIVKRALDEDVGEEDLTTQATVPPDKVVKAILLAEEEGIIAGLPIAFEVFKELDPDIEIEQEVEDGSKIFPSQILAYLTGKAYAILTGERTALNFLQRLSGIATLTARYVEAAGRDSLIYDTRKTTPNLRELEKYAVRMGGGMNHRKGLYDEILIKENHIRIAGGPANAIRSVKNKYPNAQIEIEVQTFAELKEAIATGVDIIMLDNMHFGAIKKAIKHIKESKKPIQIEVSGGIKLEDIPKLASLQVDRISVGALTHSAKSLNLSLEIRNLNGP
jgi:nicotinate-nucleotide pyrophosphorylase (carboxylating)